MREPFKTLLLFVAVALQWGCAANGNHDSYNNRPATAIRINVSASDPKPVEQNIYGFSTSSMYWQLDAVNDTFLRAVQDLKPRVLRFPGGTLAQFYHWDQRGYGFNFNEVKKHHSAYAESLKEQNAYDAKRGARYIDDFVALAKQLNCGVVYCANMLTGSVEEMTAALRFFQQQGVNVVGVELGNEMYLPKLRTFYPTPQSYIHAAKPYAAALRRHFPNVRIGAVAAPYLRISDEPNETNRESNYYKTFNDALAKETFYDAYIVHYYFPFDCDAVASDCSVTRLSHIVKEQLPKSFAYYTGLFGTERKQWITEWNIATAQTKGRYGNTAFQALFIQAFYHTLNELNARYNNVVDIATYQTLAGNVIGSNTITEPFKREPYRDLQFGRFLRRVPWFANALVEPVYNGNVQMLKVAVSPVIDNVYVYAYRSFVSNDITVYILNASLTDVTINYVDVEGTLLQNAAINFLQPEAASAGFGWNKANGHAGHAEGIRPDVRSVGFPVTVKRFGCGYLHGSIP